jgi:RNA polymerase sigma-70 factor (ECF subfamily)
VRADEAVVSIGGLGMGDDGRVAARGRPPASPEVPAAVVAAARHGDADAFMTIFDAFNDRLRGLAFRILGDADLMDDALQEVAVKAFPGIRAFRGDSSVGTWLYRITYTTCLNLLRTRDRVMPLPDPLEDLSGGSDPVDDVSVRSELAAALASLSADHRAVVSLVIEEGLDHRTAGEVLGVPPGTIASRLSYARAALRKCLAEPVRTEEEP